MMKKASILIIVFALCSQLFSQSKEDSLAIKKTAQDYVEGWATANIERVAKAVSPELAKRQVHHDQDGFGFISNMSSSLLLKVTKDNRDGVKIKDHTPGEPFLVDIKILDIDGNNASVKTFNKKYGFMDYIHLAKMNKEWKIINVLWDWSSAK